MRIPTLLITLLLSTQVVAQDAQREFIPVAGDVYLFRNNFHLSLIVPTGEGVVRVDPINAEASAWLKDNLNQITDEEVTHLIWSHSHGDHGSGGQVHAGAEFIAHEDAPFTIAGATPTMRVGDNHTMTVGSKTFELANLGGGHDNHMLVVIVRPENVAFIVDVAAPKRLPFRNFGGANIDDWIDQIKAAQALDFDIFAPGHGVVGVKADLDGALQYMMDLRAGVLEGLKAGKSVETLQAELTLDEYKDWLAYDQWRTLNIEGMAAYLEGAGLVN